nr:ATP-binding protein [Novosphingobium flavum]
MHHVHGTRGIAYAIDVPQPCELAVDREDLDEMVGNLLDNAGKWAHTQVRLKARIDRQLVLIDVCDDGPGIAADDISMALRPGARLDEDEMGYGFGLAIVQELAQLYGGRLALGRSADLGGLNVELALPRRA